MRDPPVLLSYPDPSLSDGTIVLFTLAASAMALSFGAIYPQFETENAAQIPTSFGGLVFMMSSVSGSS